MNRRALQKSFVAFLAATVCHAAAVGGTWSKGDKILPKSADIELKSGWSTVGTVGAIAWPAAVEKVNGHWLLIADDGMNSEAGFPVQGWVRKDEVVKLDDAFRQYSDFLQRRPWAAWAYWLRGIASENAKEFDLAIADYSWVIDHAKGAPSDIVADARAGRGRCRHLRWQARQTSTTDLAQPSVAGKVKLALEGAAQWERLAAVARSAAKNAAAASSAEIAGNVEQVTPENKPSSEIAKQAAEAADSACGNLLDAADAVEEAMAHARPNELLDGPGVPPELVAAHEVFRIATELFQRPRYYFDWSQSYFTGQPRQFFKSDFALALATASLLASPADWGAMPTPTGLRPTNALAYLNRGYIFESRGQKENALADYDKAIGLDSTGGLAHFYRASLLVHSSTTPAERRLAVESASAAAKHLDYSFETLELLATTLFELGDYQEAVFRQLQAVKRAPFEKLPFEQCQLKKYQASIGNPSPPPRVSARPDDARRETVSSMAKMLKAD